MNTRSQGNVPRKRRFRICIAGRLDDRFADGFSDTNLLESPEGSIIDGPFIDQSYLRGILDRLWQLGIEVRRFETYLAITDDLPQAAIDKDDE